MGKCDWLIGQPTTDTTTSLPKAHLMAAIWAGAIVVFSTAEGATLCPCPILLFASVTEIALLRGADGCGVGISEVGDTEVTSSIVFGQCTHEDHGGFSRDTRIPLLRRG